jgi:hypothetical protein
LRYAHLLSITVGANCHQHYLKGVGHPPSYGKLFGDEGSCITNFFRELFSADFAKKGEEIPVYPQSRVERGTNAFRTIGL